MDIREPKPYQNFYGKPEGKGELFIQKSKASPKMRQHLALPQGKPPGTGKKSRAGHAHPAFSQGVNRESPRLLGGDSDSFATTLNEFDIKRISALAGQLDIQMEEWQPGNGVLL